MGVSENGIRTVTCRSCKREVEVPEPAEGHPHGWYYLTVGVPKWFNSRNGRCYRSVGLYCSADCLADGIAVIRSYERQEGQAYERE